MAPAAEPPRPVIDRNAPTRVSAPTGATRRIALNDTQLEVSEDALRAAFAEKAQLVAPHASGDPYGPELAFPPGYATGPLAGEARTRPPERGPVVLVAVAGGIALFVLVGAFAVRTFRTSSTSSTSSTSGATTPGSVAAAAPTSPPRATAPLEAAPPAAPLTTATLAAAAPTSPPPPAPSPPPPAPPAQRRAAEAPPAVPVVALKPAALRSRAAPTASGYSPAVKFE